LGIGTDRPRLSWVVQTTAKNWRQSAYEIEARDPNGQLKGQTGKVQSDQSVLIAWPFDPLKSRQQLSLRVRVWGSDGQVSEWSRSAVCEAGLRQRADWTAHFVTPDWDEDTSRQQPAPFLRHEFEVRPGVTSARLYITALGVYEPHLNGAVVGDHVLAPGWTSYHDRLRYQTFDVTGLLSEGRNVLGAILADGWYRGRIGFGAGKRNGWGDRLALLAQLEIQYADGTNDRIVTDESWRAATGPILSSGIYEGETYDARLERPGWSSVDFDDHDWASVRLVEQNFDVLISPVGPPVRRIEWVKPVSVFQSPAGKTLLDFGQNLVGRLRLCIPAGEAGQTITLRHAEVLEKGELCTRPLRNAEATDRFILSGKVGEYWEPCFTFHGFRYAEVDGWPGRLDPADIQAGVIHSDMERTGWFECSNSQLNRLHENILWSMRGNFLDLPTDCPQRDERLGWTGDLQVFSPTASFLFDVIGFLQSWLADLAAEQKKLGGVVPPVVPNIMGEAFGAAAWSDAAVIVPWVLYQRFGDPMILSNQFESMRSWVDHVAGVAGETRLWDRGFQFGDWLDPTAPPDKPWMARTDKNIVATAYFAHSAEIVGLAAGVLGLNDQKAHYLALAEEVRGAFAREYVTPAGRLMSDSETAYALAIAFGLLPRAEQVHSAGERLAELVRGSGYHIRTGFVGTPLMCDALSLTGNVCAAYRLLMQRDCPSWLYPVTMGATTIWERWDSMLPDGSVNPGEMTSFNHYALGAVADWMHHFIGGLAPAEPGYRRLEIRPRPGGGLTNARARLQTPYGLAECAWKIDAGTIEVNILVPANSTAQVTLPGSEKEPFEVGCGSYHWSYAYVDPDARGPLTVDDTIGEIMGFPEAWVRVTETIRHAPGTEMLLMIMQNERNQSLRQLLRMMPGSGDLLVAIETALANVGK
jgi:alpha-L-rhamnosidase